MMPKDFVDEFFELKQGLLNGYFHPIQQAACGLLIASMGLQADQIDKLRRVLDQCLTDALYTVLLGLDGCGQIGHKQVDYRLSDELGNALAGSGSVSGQIEAAAYEAFHSHDRA